MLYFSKKIKAIHVYPSRLLFLYYYKMKIGSYYNLPFSLSAFLRSFHIGNISLPQCFSLLKNIHFWIHHNLLNSRC